ncbi:MAG: G8 domain-containing protein [Bacteroidota bacterium]|nr:G8 domain-containing protein [Bacteroidota bacterium]
MNKLSFFHPKSFPVNAFCLTFIFIILIGAQAWAETKTWKGANGTNGTRWHVDTNWSPTGVPIISDDVSIPNTTSKPVIATVAVCNSLTIDASGSLTIDTGGSLTVAGNWTNNGTFTQNSGTVTFTSDNNSAISGISTTTFSSLKVNKGNGKSAEIHLNGKGAVVVNNSLTIENGLIKINTGGALNLTGTAAAPSSGIVLNGGTYTVNGNNITPKAVKTWNSLSGGNWTTTGNWNPNGAPAAGDDVIIPEGHSGTITNIPTITLSNLTINGDCTFSGNTTVTINGLFTIASGKTLQCGTTTSNTGVTISLASSATGTIDGTLIIQADNNNLTFTNSGTLTVNGTVSLLNNSQKFSTFTNSGKLTITGENYIGGAGKFTLSSGATLEIGSANGIITTPTTTGNLRNSGTRTLNAGANYTYNGSGAQSLGTGLPGTVDKLTLSGGGTKTMSEATIINSLVTIDEGVTLDESTRQMTLPGGASIVVNGTLDFSTNTGKIQNGSTGITTLTMGSTGNIRTVDPSGLGPFENASLHPAGGIWETTSISTNGTVEYYFNGSQTITNRDYNNLTTSGSGTKTIASTSVVTVNATLTTNDLLAINSDATNSGSLIMGASGTSTGGVTYNRYMAPTRWYITSAPVNATGFNSTTNVNKIHVDATVSPNLYDFATYSEPANDWLFSYQSSSAANLPNSLTPGQGYLISLKPTSDGLIKFTGALNNGDVTLTVTTSTGNGWNAVGNPYTSAIKVVGETGSGSFLDVNSGILSPDYAAIYVWNEDATYTGTEQFYKAIGNSGYAPPSGTDYGNLTSGSLNNIQAGQGFLINVNAGGQVTFNKTMQVHEAGLSLKSVETSWPGITLLAESKEQTRSTVVAFNEAMTTGLDVTYDAGLLASDNFQVYTHLVGGGNLVDFAIQCLPDHQYSQLRVPVGVDLPEGGELAFKASGVILPNGIYPIIEDKLLNVKTLLKSETDSYTVNLDKNTTGIGRFYLSMGGDMALAVPKTQPETKFTASLVNDRIVINGKVEPGTKAQLFDISGRKVGEYLLEKTNRNEIKTSDLSQKVYLLRIEGKNCNQVLKLIAIKN